MIEKRLKIHRQKVIEYGIPEIQILGIFLYGSQNYNCDTPESDVDTKAIIIPSYFDLCCGKPVIKELHLDNGEHCEVKDIREMVKMWRKQNINFLEILYTDYFILNPIYKDIWIKYFIDYRDVISHYNIESGISDIIGQTIRAIRHNPNNDNKKIANAWRLNLFLEKMLAGVNYSDCIVLSEKEREEFFSIIKNGEKYGSNNALIEHAITTGEKILDQKDKTYSKEEIKNFADKYIFNPGVINLCRCLEFVQ